MATFLFTRRPNLERDWPFVHDQMVKRLEALGTLKILNSTEDAPIHEQIDVSDVDGIAYYGGGKFTAETVAAAPKLKMVSANTDNGGYGLPLDALHERDIAIIETTRAWAQSVAECAFGLALMSLRSMGQWHEQMSAGKPLWTYHAGQFCDNPDFVNGDIGTKNVGVMGMGQIGGRIAKWCAQFGATTFGYDPFVPQSLLDEWGVERVEMDELAERADIVFVAIPPTPSAKHLLNRERIYKLRKGALVTIITRAHSVEMSALRERIVKNELAGAFDVYDVEPLPVDDELRNRANVTHTPHIAGRTVDANLRTADMTADEFERILKGQEPTFRLTKKAINVRREEKPQEGAN
ncbi:MAG: NAD(P)-dependent oxidoreductase [Candidatus Poribacteria bacterium]|nr:NAD(P)-dependent oxidoreductase [Candidatus Poribacteria bacterium]